MTRGLFATMPERADTPEAIGLNSDAPPLHSTSLIYENCPLTFFPGSTSIVSCLVRLELNCLALA